MQYIEHRELGKYSCHNSTEAIADIAVNFLELMIYLKPSMYQEWMKWTKTLKKQIEVMINERNFIF